jgi:hypothetical protein
MSNYNVEVDLDVKKLQWEDSITTKNGSPLRVAIAIPVDIDIKNNGKWTTLADSSKIWQQTVTARNAEGLIISYKDFYIPKGGKLFIYNKDRSHVLGAYTHKTFEQGGSFATESIAGDSFTLEYLESKNSSEEPRIAIESIGYMYNKSILANGFPDPGLNTSTQKCNINVNCEDGKNWQNQKRGIVLFFVLQYRAWVACTGSLINNTSQDAKPYVLTASHCFDQGPDIQFDKLIVYFNHEFSGCSNQNVAPTTQSLVGATPLVYTPLNGGSDSFLFKINTTGIPKEWKPYYNGWDRSNTPAQSGVIIHHPNMDVKKITTYVKPVTSGTFAGANETGTNISGAKDAHWEAIYDGRGVTEGGSSGSPLFNQKGLIVGTLTGGSSYCNSPLSSDFYGKIWYGWDQFYSQDPTWCGQCDQQLKTYLDPLNKGVQTLSAYDPNGTVGIEEEFIQPTQLAIFPNPTDDILHINANAIIRSIKIVNMQGKLVFDKKNYSSSTTQVIVENWNKGVYTITVETDDRKLTNKFIKQ